MQGPPFWQIPRRGQAVTTETTSSGDSAGEDDSAENSSSSHPVRPFIRDPETGRYHRKRVDEMTEDELTRFRAFNRVMGQRQRARNRAAMDALVDKLSALDREREYLRLAYLTYTRRLHQLRDAIMKKFYTGDTTVLSVLSNAKPQPASFQEGSQQARTAVPMPLDGAQSKGPHSSFQEMANSWAMCRQGTAPATLNANPAQESKV